MATYMQHTSVGAPTPGTNRTIISSTGSRTSATPITALLTPAVKEAIHSGQFMVSHFEAEAQDDEDDLASGGHGKQQDDTSAVDCETKSMLSVVGAQSTAAGQVGATDSNTVARTLLLSGSRFSLTGCVGSVGAPYAGNGLQVRPPGKLQPSIDHNLSQLFKCMSLAYRQKLTSPKWNRFRGVRLRWKDKIRLNNVIWRCWHMQFIKRENTLICQFASPLDVDTHNKPEAVVLEGKYWKRKLEAVTAEYKKWRMFHRNQLSGLSRGEPVDTLANLDLAVTGWDNQNSDNMHMLVDEDYMELMSDTLFTTFSSQPYAFPEFREIARAGLADFIQPSLYPLQPNLEDCYMDTFDRFINERLTTVPEEQPDFSDFDLGQSNNALPALPPAPPVPAGQSPPVGNHITSAMGMMKQQPPYALSTPEQHQQRHHSHQPSPSQQQNMMRAVLPTGDTGYQSNQPTPPYFTHNSVAPSQPSQQPPPQQHRQPAGSSCVLPGSQQQPPPPPLYVDVPQHKSVGGKVIGSYKGAGYNAMHPYGPVLNVVGGQMRVADSPLLGLSAGNGGGGGGGLTDYENQLMTNPNQQHGHMFIKTELPQAAAAAAAGGYKFSMPTKPNIKFASSGQHAPPGPPAGTNFKMPVRQLSSPLLVHGRPLDTAKEAAPTRTGRPRGRPRSRSNTREPIQKPPLLSAHSDPSLVTPANSYLLTQLLTTKTETTTVYSTPSIRRSMGSLSDDKSRPSMALSQSSPLGPVTVPTTLIISSAPVLSHSAITQQSILSEPLSLNTSLVPAPSPSPSTSSSAGGLSLDVPPPASVSSSLGGCGGMNSPTSSLDSSIGSPNRCGPLSGNDKVMSPHGSEHRRAHMHSEQKRRYNIKNGFDMLHSLIPHLNQNMNAKMSKAALLQKGADYIRQLRAERANVKEEMDGLKQQIESLNTSISNCQSLLPATGAPISRRQGNKMQEMYDDYIRRRTMHDWKFWIFSLLFGPLLQSFNNFVSTASLDDLYRTTISWIEQHCTLTELRPLVLNSLRHLSTKTDILSNPQLLPTEAQEAVMNTRHRKTSINDN